MGVHRIQRIPATEKQGRIHTSTASIAILPIKGRTSVRINPADIEMGFTRSGGAGGQNVNKVNSKAILRWPIAESSALSPKVKARFYAKYRTRIANSGDLIIASEKHRDREKNIRECFAKLDEMIESVYDEPIKRIDTKPSKAVRARDRVAKNFHSKKKDARKRVRSDSHD